MNITLRPVSDYRNAIFFLYLLLGQRTKDQSISHKEMPGKHQHAKFVRSRPYRLWFIIKADGEPVGSIYATRQNEIGIQIAKARQGLGIGMKALNLLTSRYKPLPEIPGKRAGVWLANISKDNDRSIDFFEKAGFSLRQYTFQR